MKKQDKQQALTKTRLKVKSEWSKYNAKKAHILASKRISSNQKQIKIKKYKQETLNNISKDFSSYRIKVYNKHNKSVLKKTKEYLLKTGSEVHYKLKSKTSNALYKALLKLQKDKSLRYCLVNIELYFNDIDQTQFLTQNFTPIALERIDENVLFDIIGAYIKKNSKESFVSSDYEVKNVFIRLIYENTKASKTKEVRKYRTSKK